MLNYITVKLYNIIIIRYIKKNKFCHCCKRLVGKISEMMISAAKMKREASGFWFWQKIGRLGRTQAKSQTDGTGIDRCVGSMFHDQRRTI